MGSVVTMSNCCWSDRATLLAWAAKPEQQRRFPELVEHLIPVPYSNRRRIEERADFNVCYLLVDTCRHGINGLCVRLSPVPYDSFHNVFPFMKDKVAAGYIGAHCFGWEDARDTICCYLQM